MITRTEAQCCMHTRDLLCVAPEPYSLRIFVSVTLFNAEDYETTSCLALDRHPI